MSDDAMAGSGAATEGLNFLSGGGELGTFIRRFDWASTPLGPACNWPRNLRTALRIMLTSRQPIWIGWGPELTYFYNDPYKSIVGGKHPQALGRPAAEVWREIWAYIGPMLETAMRGDQGTYVEAQLLIMERNGYPEETYYTFSYSPIPNDDGTVGGIICANSEDTRRVVGERQLALLRNLAADTTRARSWQEVCERSASALQTDPRDIPFAMIYVGEPDCHELRLAGAVGIDPGHPAAPDRIPLDRPTFWPVSDAFRLHRFELVTDLDDIGIAALPSGPWSRPPRQAAILPILTIGDTGVSGVLIVGLNPFRLFDEDYHSFLGLVAGQIGGALRNAEAYESERRRAEALAAIDRAKTTFFSNVSHEFRTPLTLMIGPIEDALNDHSRGGLPGIQRERLQTAHRNSLRLLKLVNSLLDFSRIEAGRAQACYEPADLAQLTAELASNFESAMEKAGLSLSIDCPTLPYPVHIDRNLWEKVILNLLSNAFKFTFEGGVKIKVGISQDGRRAETTISDSGVGVSEPEQQRLFDRFHRIQGQRSRSFEGSGIGLALVQEVVKLHGGSIRVESELNVGTSFMIDIPFGTAHLPEAQIGSGRAQSPTLLRAQVYVDEALRWLPESGSDPLVSVVDRSDEALPAVPGSPVEGATVLVADDNADMRNYIRRLLDTRWQVETVADGQSALSAIRARMPDLLLSDVMMPGLNGVELLRELRSDPRLRDLPVILLSARAGEEARIEGIDAGANDYLTKPFSARELVARVTSNLEMARIRREAERALKQSNELLEQRVEAAIAERVDAETRLRQALKMEAIGKLTGGVAHDFNNLLQVIAGNLQLLSREVAGNTHAERRVQAAQRAVDKGAKLSSQLLSFGRRQPLAPKVVNLGRLVRSIDDMLRRTLGEGIEIETAIADGLWNTFIDVAQVENAILNLAINARDAMNGSGRLTIEVENASLDDDAARHGDMTSGQYIMLAITDTGCGISGELIDRVFEPFFTTKPEGQGTGLGLSMVYGFVKQSQGHIKIYSEPGQGTTVRVYLPRVRAPQDVESVVEMLAPAGGNETVLVVEDDEDVRRTVVDMIAELGYRVLKSKDAESALAIVESGLPIDLLFTDVVMPGRLRSPELARKAKERLPNIAILFTSGYAENAIVHGGRLDDGIDLLSKPYSREALARKFRQVLGSRSQHAFARNLPAARMEMDAGADLRSTAKPV